MTKNFFTNANLRNKPIRITTIIKRVNLYL